MRKYHVRWMDCSCEFPQVMAIERLTFEFPWREVDFVKILHQRNVVVMVAECKEQIVGYIVHELHKTDFHILNLAVAPPHRRRGLGSYMVSMLAGKLAKGRREKIVTEVRETNFATQNFFSSLGFRATKVLRDFYEDCGEDAYEFQYRLKRKGKGFVPKNRMKFGERNATDV